MTKRRMIDDEIGIDWGVVVPFSLIEYSVKFG